MKRKIPALAAVLLLLAAVIVAGCSNEQEAEADANFKQDKAQLMEELRGAINAVDQKLSSLQATADSATDTMSNETMAAADSISMNMMQQLKDQKSKLTEQMQEVQAATMQNFDQMKSTTKDMIEHTTQMMNGQMMNGQMMGDHAMDSMHTQSSKMMTDQSSGY